MSNLFNPKDYQSFLARLDQLQADQQPLWGNMTPAQMLAHCTATQEACNGQPLTQTPLFVRLFRGFIKKSVLDDKPYKKGIPTHPQYLIRDERDFEVEKAKFLASLEKFVANTGSAEHSLFGTLTAEERNKAIYKHHNHHWEQFGL